MGNTDFLLHRNSEKYKVHLRLLHLALGLCDAYAEWCHLLHDTPIGPKENNMDCWQLCNASAYSIDPSQQGDKWGLLLHAPKGIEGRIPCTKGHRRQNSIQSDGRTWKFNGSGCWAEGHNHNAVLGNLHSARQMILSLLAHKDPCLVSAPHSVLLLS